MNLVGFSGRIAKEPVFQSNGTYSTVRFTLLRNEYAGKDKTTGERKPDRVVRCRCMAWGKVAETVHKYCHAGDQLIIEGRQHSPEPRQKEGSTEMQYFENEIVLTSMEFGLPGKKSQQLRAANQTEAPSQERVYSAQLDDDIPF